MNTSLDDIRNRISEGPLVFNQLLIIVICFLINIADGFDVLAMSYAAPALRADWGVEATELGVIFSAALAGMTMGAMFLSPLSDRFGRRTLILASVGLSSAAMLATPFTSSITELVVVRFLTGLGIGGVLASAASMATEYSPGRYRSFAVIFVQSGYSVGSVIAGPIAAHVIPADGWQQLFWYGGLLTASLFFVALFLLPESIDYIALKRGNDERRLKKINRLLNRIQRESVDSLPAPADASANTTGAITSLLNSEYRNRTLTLWIIFFAAFWSTYLLVNWIPTLFVTSGLTQQQGIFALTLYTLGGLVGAWVLGYLSTLMPLTRLIITMFSATAVMLGVFAALGSNSLTLLNALVLIIGFCFTAGFTAMYAVAAQNYPTEIRTTGVGWCIGLGRFGAILSPMVAGVMVSAGWGMSGLFLTIAIPPVLLAVFFLCRLEK